MPRSHRVLYAHHCCEILARFWYTNIAYGGSWADDDIDLASISVPIERSRHQSHHETFGGSSRSVRGAPGDPGPPYIIKLLQLPVACNNLFVEDLFQSRYTPYVKFKILVDPAADPLQTGTVRKIAFVELESYQDYSKALKWHDLYYRQGRRVVVEMADFQDFQHSVKYNQEHQQQLLELEQDVASGKFRLTGSSGPMNRGSPIAPHRSLGPKLGSHAGAGSGAETSKPGFDTVLSKPKPKPNPFGAARPVDVLAKEGEIQKKLITVNHTTIKTMGSINSDPPRERRKSMNILRRDSKAEDSPQPPAAAAEQPNSKYSPAPAASVYGDGKSGISLAQILSAANSDSNLAANSAKNSPKPAVSKPTILRKKAMNSPALSVQQLARNEAHGPETTETTETQAKLPQNTDDSAIEHLVETTDKTTLKEKGNADKNPSPTKDVDLPSENNKASAPTTQTSANLKNRPDFKHMFEEITQKYVPKEKPNKFKGRGPFRETNVNGKTTSESDDKNASRNNSSAKPNGRKNSRDIPSGPRRPPKARTPRRRDGPEEKKGDDVVTQNGEGKVERSNDKLRASSLTSKQEVKSSTTRDSVPNGDGERNSARKERATSSGARRGSASNKQTDKTIDDSTNHSEPGERPKRGSGNSRGRGGNRRRGRGGANLHYVRNEQLNQEKAPVLETVQ